MTPVAAPPQGIDQALQLDLGYLLSRGEFFNLLFILSNLLIVFDDHSHTGLDELSDSQPFGDRL